MLKLAYVIGVLSLKVTLPVKVIPGLAPTRSLNLFKSEVLPAPDAPIIKVSSPGMQKPVQPLRILKDFYAGEPSAISSFVALSVTENSISVKLILHTSEPSIYIFAILFSLSSLFSELLRIDYDIDFVLY